MMLLPEERLRRLEGTNVLLLRPVSFFENFYDALGLIKHQGINGRPATSPTSAQALKARDWEGVVVRELLGPRDLTYSEATRILGERIGSPRSFNSFQFALRRQVQGASAGGL